MHISSTAELREFILNTAPNIISPQTSLEHVYDKSRKSGDTIRHTEQTFALRAGVHYVPWHEAGQSTCEARCLNLITRRAPCERLAENAARATRKSLRASKKLGQETCVEFSDQKHFSLPEYFLREMPQIFSSLSNNLRTYDSAEATGEHKPPGMECNLDYFVHVPAEIPSDEKYLESIAGMSDDDWSISRCGFLIRAPLKDH